MKLWLLGPIEVQNGQKMDQKWGQKNEITLFLTRGQRSSETSLSGL